jgi:Ca2+-transporting ATPase
MGLGHHGDAMVILAVVLVNALIGSVQEGRAERSMAALRRLSALRVRVVRNGGELVSRRATWCRVTPCCWPRATRWPPMPAWSKRPSCSVAEAALTGESVPVSKSVAAVPEATGLADRHCMVYSGTHVTAGRARAASSWPPACTPKWAASPA